MGECVSVLLCHLTSELSRLGRSLGHVVTGPWLHRLRRALPPIVRRLHGDYCRV